MRLIHKTKKLGKYTLWCFLRGHSHIGTKCVQCMKPLIERWECKVFGHRYVDNIIELHEDNIITVQSTCFRCNHKSRFYYLPKENVHVWGQYE